MPLDFGKLTYEYLDACQLALTAESLPPEWIQLIPAGQDIETCDGRKFKNPNPQAVVEAFSRHGVDLPIDIEHAGEIRAPKGEPAPATGWIKQIELRDGVLWGRVEWTSLGANYLKSKEYRYFSPAFFRDFDTRVITGLKSGALTNQPAFNQLPALAHQMELALELAAQWDTAFVNDLPDSAFLYVEDGGEKDGGGKTVPRSLRHFPYRDAEGGIDLPHLRNAIARIPQSQIAGSDKQKLQEKAQRLLAEHNQAATASQENDSMDKELLSALGLGEKATAEEAKAAAVALKQSAEKVSTELASAKTELARAQTPDLGKFVPRADYDVQFARAEKAEKVIETEKAAALEKEIAGVIDQAVKDGKITPATKSFYVETCKSTEGLTAVREFLKVAPVIAPDNAAPAKKPETETATQITDEQRAIIERCGITIEQFKKGEE